AQTLAAVNHDHVVSIFQVGEERNVPFIAMPFLQGESLEDRLKRDGKLPVAEVLRIGREIAEGLAAAHERGLIHRDVKPANIWLEAGRTSPRVKVLDFGLARPDAADVNLTHSAAILGTPAYMAPEQARGEAVDARADLFSLGCVLYRLATGEPPFKGNDPLTVMVALATVTPPAPESVAPDVPAELSALIMQLLSKEAAGRPNSALEVAEKLAGMQAVENAASESGVQTAASAPVQPPRRRGMIALAAAAGAAALLAGIIIVIKDRQGKVVATIRAEDSVAVEPGEGYTIGASSSEMDGKPKSAGDASQKVKQPGDHGERGRGEKAGVPRSASPHGGKAQADPKVLKPAPPLPALSEMALVSEPSPIGGVKSWTLETIDHRGEIYRMQFSPDGGLLATYGEDGAVRLWKSETGELVRVLIGADSPSGGLAWSPDGKAIAVAAGTKITAWVVAGGKTLKTLELQDGEAASLAWSPDGKQFAVGQRPASTREGPARTLHVYDAENGELVTSRQRDDWDMQQLAWSPDSRRLLISATLRTTDFLVDLDQPGASIAADPIYGPGRAVTWTSDGVPLIAGHQDPSLCVGRFDAKEPLHHFTPPGERTR
ncbi:MAG TPA: serine/threonine-protein kinase, partial [Pirellulales bacterium]|nr:serine/threonine-protein kinase [Pirellulales bacterium]